jgi:hypothetical protein
MWSSGRRRRRATIILISALGTFSVGLQTQDYLCVKLCPNRRRPTRRLGRERLNESFHQQSIRTVRPVDLNRRRILRRPVRGKARRVAFVATGFLCHAFRFWMWGPLLAHNHRIARMDPSCRTQTTKFHSHGLIEKSWPRPILL